MSPIIRTCIDSIKSNAGNHSVIIITSDNLSQYIDIPREIFEKIESKQMSLTHMADLIRFFVLSKYGGWWFDSTVFVTKPIMNDGYNMYTVKSSVYRKRYIGGGCNWTAYLFACGKNNPFMPILRDAYLYYWLENETLIDYFMVDYIIQLMYEKCPSFRKEIDKIPIDNEGVNNLYINRFCPYSDERWNHLTNLRFNKLNWRCGDPIPGSIFEKILKYD